MEPKISVGILTAPSVRWTLHGDFIHDGRTVTGVCEARFDTGGIVCGKARYNRLQLVPTSPTCSFTLHDVPIGIGFHWQRNEDQWFAGALEVITNGEQLVAINRLGVEEYLASVITSEMNASSSSALLEAHAVISRSWLLSQIEKRNASAGSHTAVVATDRIDEDGTIERTRWYDREDHLLFDVCADDHCQRYQGFTRIGSHAGKVRAALGRTRGEVLMYDEAICDTRFSKCCGGLSERYGNCWDEHDYPYLTEVRDNEDKAPWGDLHDERQATAWIESSPKAYCNTTDRGILSQVLNSYDLETPDFYRWKVRYSQSELSEIVSRRSGVDFGTVRDLIPVSRGVSGRLVQLKIVGDKCTMIVGKELEIRKTLSNTHLYSSAFVVRREGTDFILHGAGWGHGVGLCQIGAAVMGDRGMSYDQILKHYYRGASIKKLY